VIIVDPGVLYGDLLLGGTDAAVIAVAERLGAVDVATVDHRHFRVVRPRHVPPSLSCRTSRRDRAVAWAPQRDGQASVFQRR
jgi:hypothetical protein